MTDAPADSGGYYRFRSRQVNLRGEALTVFCRPGLGDQRDTAAAARLLALGAEVREAARVLVLHCGDGLAGVAAARMTPHGQVVMIDARHTAVLSARQTALANAADNVQVLLGDCAQPVLASDPEGFDAVLALLPKGRATWEQTVLDAAVVLRPGGTFYLAGANNCGIRTAGKFMAEVFGQAEVTAYKAGSRLFRATRPAGIAQPPSDYYRWRQVEVEVSGRKLAYLTRPGLFSREALDGGTRLLIEALLSGAGGRVGGADRVLDLGCGCGVLTLLAARQAPKGHAVGVDVDCRAVEATRRTLQVNGIRNAEAILSDCVEAVADRRFDLVLTNPPLHQGRQQALAVSRQFIRDAAAVLRPDGKLYLVVNRFLKYGGALERAFGRAEIAREDEKFKVWCARKRQVASSQ